MFVLVQPDLEKQELEPPELVQPELERPSTLPRDEEKIAKTRTLMRVHTLSGNPDATCKRNALGNNRAYVQWCQSLLYLLYLL
jgi:hypothetical protein